MIVALLALGLAMGVDPRRLLFLGLAVHLPLVALCGVVGLFMMSIRGSDARPVLFCEGMAAELRSGSSLREALAASATAVGSQGLADESRHGGLGAVATRAGIEFPTLARELEITIVNSARTGSAAADLFDEVGSLALAQEEMRREVRVAAAPAKAAAVVFVVLPAGFVVSRWNSGDIVVLLASPIQRGMTLVGLGLFMLGLVVAGLLVWRAK